MPVNPRQRRQKAFYFRVTANFILFCLVAVPLQFHIQMYGNLYVSKPDWLANILRSGPMYFYSLTLCIEANLRLEHYPYLLFGDRRVYLLRLLLLLPIVIFGLQYFISPLYKDITKPLPSFEQITLIYAGDTGDKWGYFNTPLLSSLGVDVDAHGKMPDVVLYDTKRDWLLLIESVTSHGPVDGKRHAELARLFAGAKAGLVYVTAFPTRATMARYLGEIAWETEVWVAEAPSHLIHFDGKRFLGPYKAT